MVAKVENTRLQGCLWQLVFGFLGAISNGSQVLSLLPSAAFRMELYDEDMFACTAPSPQGIRAARLAATVELTRNRISELEYDQKHFAGSLLVVVPGRPNDPRTYPPSQVKVFQVRVDPPTSLSVLCEVSSALTPLPDGWSVVSSDYGQALAEERAVAVCAARSRLASMLDGVS
jgi:hypothetical protein